MTFSSSLSSNERVLVLDASVLINLIGSGCSERILAALSVPVWVSDYAANEILDGGHEDAVVMKILFDGGLINRKPMMSAASSLFEDLVSGATQESLGDGEAATIAIASGSGAIAVIDERQGWRIANGRLPGLQLATTVDIFALPSVKMMLGEKALGEAVYSSLVRARMQVREHQLDWVVGCIGSEAASACRSLARLIRHRASMARQKG
jgi:predicted nucleic acid-binding protein